MHLWITSDNCASNPRVLLQYFIHNSINTLEKKEPPPDLKPLNTCSINFLLTVAQCCATTREIQSTQTTPRQSRRTIPPRGNKPGGFIKCAPTKNMSLQQIINKRRRVLYSIFAYMNQALSKKTFVCAYCNAKEQTESLITSNTFMQRKRSW